MGRVHETVNEFKKIKDEIILEEDFAKYMDDAFIEEANKKALAYVEKESIDELSKEYHIKSFLIDYTKEQIVMYKKLKRISDSKLRRGCNK